MVTNLFTTASTKKLSLSVIVPVIENGDVPLVLSVDFPPAYISRSFLHQLLPQGSIGMVVDGNHMVIARTAGEAEFLGHPASADFVISVGLDPHTAGVPLARVWKFGGGQYFVGAVRR